MCVCVCVFVCVCVCVCERERERELRTDYVHYIDLELWLTLRRAQEHKTDYNNHYAMLCTFVHILYIDEMDEW